MSDSPNPLAETPMERLEAWKANATAICERGAQMIYEYDREHIRDADTGERVMPPWSEAFEENKQLNRCRTALVLDAIDYDGLRAEITRLTADCARKDHERDSAYVKMIDTAGFLRGYGDAAEVAARSLTAAVPEDFDDREEAFRAAASARGEGSGR